MERTQLFDLMGELKLYGMKASFDEIMMTAVKRSRFSEATNDPIEAHSTYLHLATASILLSSKKVISTPHWVKRMAWL